jgi:hypothetical protein
MASARALGDIMRGAVDRAAQASAGNGGNASSSSTPLHEGGDGITFLSVGAQVDALLALATDEDVLGRQYLGLNTWL